jgi:hypothetical protein|tara:strand:- start:482 stop:802 length:321 start_codon:yes stop_codon:yes gene_type:complete
LNKLIFSLFLAFSIQAEDLIFECQNQNKNQDKQKLVIQYEEKRFVFKENIYLYNSYKDAKIFAQRRTILLNSFLEFNERTNELTEVNSWLYKVTKDDYICKNSDSK